MLVKDCADKQVNLLSDLSSTEFYIATKGVYDKYPDHPFPTIGEDNWESFAYLIAKGTYAGSLIKRLAKWMKKEKGFTPDPKFIGEIGNAIGKTQSKSMESYLVTISTWFDWTPGTFNRNQSGGSSETDSCFWKSRNCAREALRDIYDARSVIIKDKNGNNLARCWLISASNDDFMRLDGLGSKEHDIIFNAYGNLELYKIARILTYCGYSSYNKVNFYSTDGYRMYVNGEMGFALSISGNECDRPLRIDPSYGYHECDRCDYTSIEYIGECPVCESHYIDCSHCGNRVYEENGTWVDDNHFVCDSCYSDRYASCWSCGDHDLQEDMIRYGDRWYCKRCYSRLFVPCSHCGESHPKSKMYSVSSDGLFCSQCFHNGYSKCNQCGKIVQKDHILNITRLNARYIDSYTQLDYLQLELELEKESFCAECTQTRLIQLSETVYIKPQHLSLIKRKLTDEIIIYRDTEGHFAFGLDFGYSDFGVQDFDGDSVFHTMNLLIDRFKELSKVEYHNVFSQVVKFDNYQFYKVNIPEVGRN